VALAGLPRPRGRAPARDGAGGPRSPAAPPRPRCGRAPPRHPRRRPAAPPGGGGHVCARPDPGAGRLPASARELGVGLDTAAELGRLAAPAAP